MRVLADRFLLDDDDVVDLATGESVRLSIECAPRAADVRNRLWRCDTLAALRHPLLLPLVDYGLDGERWFEAHATRPPYRASPRVAREAALHLVRFLRAHEVELPSREAARHVRPAIELGMESGPVLGFRLCWRAAIDAVRVVFETGGPSGVTRVTVHGPVGSGLRTARMLLARAARLAGYVVFDARLGASARPMTGGRHCCVIEWLPSARVLPAVLADPVLVAAAHHVWLRFTRERPRDEFAVALEPLTTSEMTAMIYRDAELGPADELLRSAVRDARGWPGLLLDRLATSERPSSAMSWIHETAPAYASDSVAPEADPVATPQARAGVGRLTRILAAANAVAARGGHARAERLLRKCGQALEARGSLPLASDAHRALADLLLRRGRAGEALAHFHRAAACSSADRSSSVLLGTARALIHLGRSGEAEATLKTLLAGGEDACKGCAAALLARICLDRGDGRAAAEYCRAYAGDRHPELALAEALVARARGDVVAALQAAKSASRNGAQDVACEAHLLLAELHGLMSDAPRVRESLTAAADAARNAREPALQLVVRAATIAFLYAAPRRSSAESRLLRICARLPIFRAEQIRRLLSRAPARSRVDSDDPGGTLEALIGICVGAPDDASAVAALVEHLKVSTRGCSAAAWTARDARQIALAGRAWSDSGFARMVMNAGTGAFRNGVAPEAAEPVRAGGSTVGCLAVRWPAGGAPAAPDARHLLRLAAAAVAPSIVVLNDPRPAPPVAPGLPDEVLGTGPRADALRALIARAAAAPYPVLIEGESGSGKEVVARAIHARGPRRTRRFCAVNCAAFTEDLLEAELFGHTRGAFTGAAAERQGLFEEADQGTLFLDEVAELSPRGQAKLLRALQEGEIRRVGENLSRRVDVRIVAATNRPLEREVDAGRFRADLRFRLDVVRIAVPPLRDRADEIPALVERIWSEAAARVGTRATLGPEVISALARYEWPGNVRELQNVLAALAVHAPTRGRVPASLLAPRIAEAAARRHGKFEDARLDFERRFVRAALARAAGRKRAAAAELGVTRQGLDKMLKRLGLANAV